MGNCRRWGKPIVGRRKIVLVHLLQGPPNCPELCDTLGYRRDSTQDAQGL
nr:hypothetical protein Q903MT_gene2609 [Picea sitchensis]